MATSIEVNYQAEIWTEGKTDWRILKKAMGDLKINQNIVFHENDKETGSDKLLKALQTYSEKQNITPMIFIFDHDEINIISQVTEREHNYKDWGNNVYSFAIPIPNHRKGYENVSIEMYFSDEELKRPDRDGRRFYFTSEFHERSGRHSSDPSISCAKTGHLKGCTTNQKAKILDSDVFDSNSRELALSKIKFANYVYEGNEPFDNLDFSKFHAIFKITEEIIKASLPNQSVYYPDLNKLFERIDANERAQQLRIVFQTLTDVITIALQIFSISVIRVYEQQIINEPGDFRKKVLPIKKIINEAFRKPSINTLQELAEKCFYLVGSEGQASLISMKECLSSLITLEEVGDVLDNLETLFCADLSKGQIVNKKALRWDLLKRLVPELAIFLSKPNEVVEQAINSVADHPEVEIVVWKKALEKMINAFNPIFSHKLIFKKIIDLDRSTDEYISEVRVYESEKISTRTERIQRIDDDYDRKSSILALAESFHIQIFPFLLICDDAVYYYRRTLPSGFEYFSPVKGRIHIEQTKRKFNHYYSNQVANKNYFGLTYCRKRTLSTAYEQISLMRDR